MTLHPKLLPLLAKAAFALRLTRSPAASQLAQDLEQLAIELQTEPLSPPLGTIPPQEAVELARVFRYCHSPGLAAKAQALADLLRLGITKEQILQVAADPNNYKLDFFDITKQIRALRPKLDYMEQLKREISKP